MKLQVTVIGAGMIVHDLILPSLYQLQRAGVISGIQVCATRVNRLKALATSKDFQAAFPSQSFRPFPDLSEQDNKLFPELYREVIGDVPPYNLVVVAVPDQLHYPVITTALENNQHVLCVKPLVLKFQQSAEITQSAKEKGLFVGIEYHKRFDRRSLDAKRNYLQGRFGQFKCGEAKLIEPWNYRNSNFQNWFTKENTDPFTYIGCHYVDLCHFITGLRPTKVSLEGVEGSFPNGNVGYMWANGRVTFENGAVLSVINGLGYPDEGAGSNDQAMCLYCESDDHGAVIKHNDQFRGVTHSYIDKEAGKTPFQFINPDFFRLVPWQGEGLKPVGYGYDSIEANVLCALRMAKDTEGLSPADALSNRKAILDEIDRKGIIATPKNSFVNELVIEAARLSILSNGRSVIIEYGARPGVKFQ